MSFKLLKILVNHSIQELLINRQTAILTAGLGFLFFSLEIVAGVVFFEQTDTLLGWSRQDYLLLVSTASSISFLYQMLFIASHEYLADAILNGELDHVLVRPVDSFWYFALYRIDIPGVFNLLVTSGVQWYLLQSYTLSVLQLLLFVMAMILSAYFLFILNQLVVSVSFWKDYATNIVGLPEYMMEFSSRPLVIYPTTIRFVLTWIIPLLIGVNLPVLIVKGEDYLIYICYLILVDVLGTWIARYIWKKGLIQYASAN